MGISSCTSNIYINQRNDQIKTEEKQVGKSTLNNIMSKLEIFGRKEISINIKSPSINFDLSTRISNTELIGNILHDYYQNYTTSVIATLNGYIISNDLSLKDNLVQENDDIFFSEPLKIYFSFINGNEYLITVSLYQLFVDVFQKFRNDICPEEYRNELYEAYYNNRLVQPFDVILNLGIKQYEKIFIFLGKDNNTKSIYNNGLEIIDRINFTYFDNKNKISVNDYKLELSNKILDDKELNNFGIINFRNLKILNLIDCNIKNLDFINSSAFSNLKEVNLQKNKISYFVDITHHKLEKLDLSYNNLKRNMVKPEINDISDLNFCSTVRLNKYLSLFFPQLKYLNLSHNQIMSINILVQLNAVELKELNLSYNEIKNIDILKNVPFGKLKRLNLSYNKIEELKDLDNLAFCNNIEEINLMNNEIVNLNVLRNVGLPKLKKLNLLHNDVNDFSVLKLIFFPKLEILYIFPYQLDPDNYDKYSEIFINFKNCCKHIIDKNIEVKYKL